MCVCVCDFSHTFRIPIVIANNWYKVMLNSKAKFKVWNFNGAKNFELWQRCVKDLLAHKGFLKALCDAKPNKMDDLGWEELQERVATIICLCLEDEVLYHVMELTSPGEVWKKL